MAHRTPEEKIQVCERVCEKYATALYTIASCVESEGISEKSFNLWASEIAEITDMYKAAKAKHNLTQKGQLKTACLTSLMKLVSGYEYDEVHQEVNPQYDKKGKQIGTRTKSVKRIKKHYQPNVTAVIFTLKSLDEQFKNNGHLEEQAVDQVFLIGGKEIKF